jgi:hypothetical protein
MINEKTEAPITREDVTSNYDISGLIGKLLDKTMENAGRLEYFSLDYSKALYSLSSNEVHKKMNETAPAM